MYLYGMLDEKKEWFADWFDTTYYHTLYQNRDDVEAKKFITRLVQELPLLEGAHVLDLACGKGRHAITLSELGFEVLGVDLSPNSISCAASFEDDHLKFAVHDMREVIVGERFQAIFNLFTSFGYFDSLEDNARVVSAISTMLEDDGLLVIDFMNAHRVIKQLVETESKTLDDITFNISREFDGTHIFKNISFFADGQNHYFTERVQGLFLADFTSLLESENFQILRTFGDFDLNPFNEDESDRLIIIAKK
jgi:2-polyprenyl-3-methyl-5-hydroxy-6-metoxy-1,4-benzoquinol methylase